MQIATCAPRPSLVRHALIATLVVLPVLPLAGCSESSASETKSGLGGGPPAPAWVLPVPASRANWKK